MKRFLILFITVFALISFNINVLAANKAKVYADSISAKQGKTLTIPVQIKENKGLMGFKISLEYPANVIRIDSVSKGTITKSGNFNHNNGLKDGIIDIIWNSVEDVKGDGTLFIVNVFIKSELQQNEKIKITYSQPDTFNEKWQDVFLDCNDIILLSENHKSKQTEINDKSNVVTSGSVINSSKKQNIDDKYVVDTVISVLKQNGYEALEQASNNKDFLKKINEELGTMFSDFESIKNNYNKSYQNEFIKKVTSSIDNENIVKAVKKAMSKNNIKSIETGSDNNEFIEDVQNELNKYSNNIPKIISEQSTE